MTEYKQYKLCTTCDTPCLLFNGIIVNAQNEKQEWIVPMDNSWTPYIDGASPFDMIDCKKERVGELLSIREAHDLQAI